jgi:hypothetical protein
MSRPVLGARYRDTMRSSSRFPIALLVSAALAACAHAGPAQPQASAVPSPRVPQSGATDTPIHVESEGHVSDAQTVVDHGRQRPLYEILALSDVGDRSANGDEHVTFDQAHITFHTAEGTRLVADAPRATVEDRTKEVVMSGGVTARTQDGAVLTCSTLHYNGRTERIHGEGDVRLTSAQGFVFTGDRLDGNVRLDHLHITKGNAR